jgi:regulator of sigma E protease
VTLFLSLLAGTLAISLLIALHEAGHMLVARRLGMRVDRFSIGFGPILWSRQVGGTEYVLSAVPLGGYVRIVGMAPGEEIDPADQSAYCNQPAWRRVLVLAAGPGANYLTAVVLAALLLGSAGMLVADDSSRIGAPLPGGPAARAGLLEGDRIRAVDGVAVDSWQALVTEVRRHPGKATPLEVERPAGEGAPTALALVITPDDVGGIGRVNVGQHTLRLRTGWLETPGEALRQTNRSVGATLSLLGGIITRKQAGGFTGPVGIAQELVRGASVGAARFLMVVWSISVALAIFNLLPIPALDGGRLIFLIVELVTRRRVSERVEGWIHAAGFAALIVLFAVVTFGDVLRWFGK